MTYTVRDVAKLSGVSVRTLHYYDKIGLLKPAYYGDNGYRIYEEKEMLQLQQVLFFRELDFSLRDIQEMMTSDTFDQINALQSHKHLLKEKAARLNRLMNTIDNTIDHLKGGSTMPKENMFNGFDQQKQEKYIQELKDRYGPSVEDKIKESQANMKNWTQTDYDIVKETGDKIHRALTEAIENGKAVDSEDVQKIIQDHYKWIEQFYTPTKEVYSGLGDLYVDHPDFRKLYDSYHPELAEVLRDAMKHFAEEQLAN